MEQRNYGAMKHTHTDAMFHLWHLSLEPLLFTSLTVQYNKSDHRITETKTQSVRLQRTHDKNTPVRIAKFPGCKHDKMARKYETI